MARTARADVLSDAVAEWVAAVPVEVVGELVLGRMPDLAVGIHDVAVLSSLAWSLWSSITTTVTSAGRKFPGRSPFRRGMVSAAFAPAIGKLGSFIHALIDLAAFTG
jgi:hypothetical protein